LVSLANVMGLSYVPAPLAQPEYEVVHPGGVLSNQP
jgi:hypothetical protein